MIRPYFIVKGEVPESEAVPRLKELLLVTVEK